mmetsp:Transcript_86480/g.197311  ORF Transcript_86480/g.197311 Transcript_86480/m.197311 type:complete len:80 (+) Transcript_86480:3504-3743(+)
MAQPCAAQGAGQHMCPLVRANLKIPAAGGKQGFAWAPAQPAAGLRSWGCCWPGSPAFAGHAPWAVECHSSVNIGRLIVG